MSKENNNKLLKGATILAVAGLFVKILGAVFRIPLTNLIGSSGMAYYGAAYSVYSFFLIIATAGFPVAISKMVAARTAVGDHRNAYKTYKVSLRLMMAMGIVAFALCFFGADFIAGIMHNPKAATSLRAISPVLILAPVVSSFRGYYQGRQEMTPTALSEVTEQLFRVIVGLSLSFILVKKSLEYAAAGATFGASVGSFAALLMMVFIFVLKKDSRNRLLKKSIRVKESSGSIVKELLKIAIPITIASSIMPIMSLMDSFMIMSRLQATGWEAATTERLYGLFSGFCNPIIGFPNVFTDAISISLVPAIAAAFALKNREEFKAHVNSGVKIMMVISYPCAVGLIVLAEPILTLLYPAQQEDAHLAVPMMKILALGVVGMAIMRTFSSILNGIGKVNLPAINLGIGALFKFVSTYILVGIHVLNVNGAAIGDVIAYFVPAILNYRAVKRITKVDLNFFDTFVRPLFASGVMGVVTIGAYKASMFVTHHNSLATLIAIMVAVVVYFVMIFVTKCITREDALSMPKGDKLVRIAEKLHLLK